MSNYELKQFTCPSCGSGMKYDPQEKVIKCISCGHSSLINIFGESEKDNIDMKCPNCGGNLVLNPATLSIECKFCDTNFSLISKDDLYNNQELEFDYIQPFETDEKKAQEVFIDWLNRGKYTPDDIFSSSFIVDLKGVYIPIWRFEGQYFVNYGATIGYDRKETYIAIEEEYNPRTQRREKVQVEKTRTVTDWYPYSNSFSDSFIYRAKAIGEFNYITNEYENIDKNNFGDRVTGARKNEDIPFSELADYCTRNADIVGIKFNEGFAAGYVKVCPNIDSDVASQSEIAGKISKDILSKIKSITPGDHVKDIYYSVDDLDADYFLMGCPFWEIIYEYNGQKYIALTGGTEKKKGIVNGTKPYDSDEAKSRIKQICFLSIGASLAAIGAIAMTIGAILNAFPLLVYIILGVLFVGGMFLLLSGIDFYYEKKRSSNKEKDYLRVKNNPGILFS